MGCDIHMYVEYKRKEREDFYDFGGRFNPGRNYLMFGVLSKGVRCDLKNGFEVKGMPPYASLAFASRNDYTYYVTDEENNEERWVTRERADGWVDKGYSIYVDEKKHFISNPDWHSHSWLTTNEYEAAIDIYRENDVPTYPIVEYKAILAAMKSLEEDGFEARIVFWFDN